MCTELLYLPDHLKHLSQLYLAMIQVQTGNQKNTQNNETETVINGSLIADDTNSSEKVKPKWI